MKKYCMTKEYMTKEYMTKEYMMKKERRRHPLKSQQIDQQTSAEVLRHSTTRNRRVEALFRQKGKGASMDDPNLRALLYWGLGTASVLFNLLFGAYRLYMNKP
ncbi:hypothetical protein OV208_40075 [Corallococcus sp. bb12-1]|uniref:hypothetical protein n=1 Tax=Corallococcus sp. bb12-1 TaxID=2996784 RepID=UPI00226FE249|nr:hypothetical protein [Corallococcus sp. bb12-1]MCY1047566.1 hypothetical protein [Corallococcus sp. bb12-1]